MLRFAMVVGVIGIAVLAALGAEPTIAQVEQQFRTLPMEARRLTGPLFWLHGMESKQRLEQYVAKVAEGGNGSFTAESRPHNDWLGPRWYEDLAICLDAARKHDLKMWIFDEKWWPSQMIGGKVPPKYATKTLVAQAVDVDGPKLFEAEGYGGPRHVAALAGKLADDGAIDGESLVDLAPNIRDGKLSWQIPAGKWKVMNFSHKQGPSLGQGGALSVDGASKDCADWFIATVYQPHYDRFKDDFGKTIPGFFYDEPETRGDWGTELNTVLAEWKVDWKKAYVAYKFRLTGDDDAAARFQYMDAFAEAWGRTMYGGMSKWCRQRGVVSMGHFMEHGLLYVNPEFCAGDMMRLQKYSDMGGIDLVCQQMYPGQRPYDIYQTPKLGSSITHVYGKDDDVTMCEMFGAYGQDITYPQMKWLTDQMQVRGVNFMIPHSFNPKSPNDRDCPPYFWNGGFEPRWPLYRVYADWTSRLSLMLSGGRHVCPVALLFSGNLRRLGKAVTPEDMTTALQDALFDCDWLPMEVFEGPDCSFDGKQVRLHQERYRILIVPPTEVIPYATLAKAREFLDKGGVVVGYGLLPTKSATVGKTAADIAACVAAIWGDAPKPGVAAVKTTPAGGKAYFLPEKPTPEQLQEALTGGASVHPTLEVLKGKTDGWLHVLHRVKAGRDVFLVCNQDVKGQAKDFRLRAWAEGVPECWDAMRNELTALPHERKGQSVEFDITLEPMESVLLAFMPEKRPLPVRLAADAKCIREPIPLVRVPVQEAAAGDLQEKKPEDQKSLDGCSWVWYPEGNAAAAAQVGGCCFRKTLSLPEKKIKSASFHITCDNDFTLYVNGVKVGASDGGEDNWRELKKVDVAKRLRAGANQLAIQAVNGGDTPNPAGLIGRLVIEFDQGYSLLVPIDKTWKAAKQEQKGWEQAGFDDSAWAAAKELVAFGGPPWGRLGGGGGGLNRSPIAASDPFVGRCELPADLDLAKSRLFLVMDALVPEEAARVTVNGTYAGGIIGKPLRLEVTPLLKHGANTIRIEPFAPKTAHLAVYDRAKFSEDPKMVAAQNAAYDGEERDARWPAEKAWKWYAGAGVIAGCNYLPRSAVNSTEMWQKESFDPKTIDEELGWAEKAGYNGIRVFLQYIVWKNDPEGILRRIDEFLAIADKHHIRVMLVPFCDCAFDAGRDPYPGKQDDPVPGVSNSRWVPSPGLKLVTDRSAWGDLEKYVKSIVGRFGNDRRVLIWDLYNEPGNSNLGDKSLPLVEAAFAWARAMKPAQPLTVGAWADFGSTMSRRLMELSDVVSFHAYDAPEGVRTKIETCRAFGRPVLCTEWLNRPGGNTFASILPLFAEHGIGGYHWGLVAGRTQTYMHWGSKKGDPMPAVWQHDVFLPDGKPYKAEEFELLRKYRTQFHLPEKK
jgi:hypothetical protein